MEMSLFCNSRSKKTSRWIPSTLDDTGRFGRDKVNEDEMFGLTLQYLFLLLVLKIKQPW